MTNVKRVVLIVITVPLILWIVFALVIGGKMVMKKRSEVSRLGPVTASLPFGGLIEAIGVTSIIYSEKKTSGIGPGSIQQTIVLYQLSSSAIEGLNNDGIDYLQKLSSNHPSMITWKDTPIEHQNNGAGDPIIIRSFMDVPPTVNERLQEMAAISENFYVTNKGVTILVSSKAKQLGIVVTK